MKQIIVKNREEAKAFANGGIRNSQRAAYWKEGKRAFRFERLPGEISATWQADVEGNWWSETQTIGQKLWITPISSAAAAMGRQGGAGKSERKTAASRENGKKGGRPLKKEIKKSKTIEPPSKEA